MRRLELGISQERLAEMLGITFQQVQKYEKGINRVAASRLFDIAGALELPIESFFEAQRLGKRVSATPVQETLATSEGMELVTLFSSVRSRKVRRRVLDLVRAMVEEE